MPWSFPHFTWIVIMRDSNKTNQVEQYWLSEIWFSVWLTHSQAWLGVPEIRQLQNCLKLAWFCFKFKISSYKSSSTWIKNFHHTSCMNFLQIMFHIIQEWFFFNSQKKYFLYLYHLKHTLITPITLYKNT